MEHLFSPGTRLQDILENQGDHEELRRHGENLQELELDVSSEELLSAERAFTYADLYALLRNGDTVAWLTPHAVVARRDGRAMDYWNQLDNSCRLCFNADGKEKIALAHSPEHLLEICDVVLRLLAVSVVHSVTLKKWSYRDIACINAPSLAYLMEQCQSLKNLTLKKLDLGEDNIRVLGDYSKPGLEISLFSCTITSAGANALAEFLGCNQGPTKLGWCSIDNVILANGLRGNSRLKLFKPRISSNLRSVTANFLQLQAPFEKTKALLN
jgi:hypothetical protein